jgi:hypothetical protein
METGIVYCVEGPGYYMEIGRSVFSKTSTKIAKICRCNIRQLFLLKRLQSSGCVTHYTAVAEKLPHINGVAVHGSGGSEL